MSDMQINIAELVTEAVGLSKYNKNKQIGAREIRTAIRLLLPQQVARNIVDYADAHFADDEDSSSRSSSRSSCSIARILLFGNNYTRGAVCYLAAAIVILDRLSTIAVFDRDNKV
jgi:hypothetical protein